jgi:hypothetical protein
MEINPLLPLLAKHSFNTVKDILNFFAVFENFYYLFEHFYLFIPLCSVEPRVVKHCTTRQEIPQ